ncbi:flagellar protein FlhE [Paracandidimonas soli]|uniref:Flagellar protein FlhE n=1 Tax=Paracandidimonas soli TaxID=1917182 RepID=A0A4R3V9E1_9BURK|nr:flagellar protein FlhE [Paracandidimonas soli]TCV01806.1 flagellar protein FlhE [Paracandidimonas soli]
MPTADSLEPGLRALLRMAALAAAMLLPLPALPAEADALWNASGTSGALTAPGREVSQHFSPEADASIPAGAKVTRVNATRRYESNAWLKTELCAASTGQCIEMHGSSVTTGAFQGQPAAQAFFLRHQVRQWAGSSPPLFIRSSVTVWYRP